MNKLLIILAFACTSIQAADIDTLLYEATRYANTPEKREAKNAARASLKKRMPQSLRAAMEYVHGDHVGLQVLVMEWVLEWPSEAVVPVLTEFIDHERSETRRVAIFFLGFHDAPELADRVTPFLDDEKCKGAAARTLGKWKTVSARPSLEKILTEGNERQRVVAANALRDLGDPAAIPTLVEALDDAEFTVRHVAARALVSFGEASAAILREEDVTISEASKRLRKRCLADMDALRIEDAVNDSAIMLDGKFFLP